MRLIDADELKETLHETIKDDPSVKWWYDLIGVDDAIDFSPTITFNPPKHGRWILDTEHKEEIYVHPVKCSVCGETEVLEGGEFAHYCPNCGARMDGEVCD